MPPTMREARTGEPVARSARRLAVSVAVPTQRDAQAHHSRVRDRHPERRRSPARALAPPARRASNSRGGCCASLCRFDADRNIIVVNSGHRDFVFATRSRALQLRYLVRLYVKELVLKNFAGSSADQLLERMIELSLYAEEKFKSG